MYIVDKLCIICSSILLLFFLIGKEDKLKFAFMAFDEEGNGVITKAELLKILKANHMASHDAEVLRKADTIMAQADKDGDGVITFDEFVIVSKKFPNILVCNIYRSIEFLFSNNN